METEESREEAIRRELELVLSSAGFARNERQSQFLRFLVDRHLEGTDSELKESVIAVEVFGREPGYDPKLDGIVRTEAIRLRARLDKYYQGEGSQDPLIIELPKGGYRPVFRQRATVAEATDSGRSTGRSRSGGLDLVDCRRARGSRTYRDRHDLVVDAPRSRAPFTVAVLPLENLGRRSSQRLLR